MALVDSQWLDGCPLIVDTGTDASGFTYWLDGLPLAMPASTVVVATEGTAAGTSTATGVTTTTVTTARHLSSLGVG